MTATGELRLFHTTRYRDRMGKPGRPATSGTRRGNGAGWGGPAKGSGPRADSIATAEPFAGQPGPGQGNWGEWKATRRVKAYNVLDRAMDDPDMRVAVTAADKMLDRLDGKTVQMVVTPDATQSWFIEGVVEAESTEAWTQQAALALAKPAGSAD